MWEINPGADGLYHTADDIRTWFSTTAFGSTDPEDVTYHPGEGVLYLVDGVNAEVYRIAPGPDGIFDGIPPAGDDVVTHFDTSAHTLDPECLTVNTDTNNLYIGGHLDGAIQELSTDGVQLQTIDISAANAKNIGGIGFGPGSADPSASRLYLVQRGVDNGSDPNENDGKLWELTLPGAPGGPVNQAPVVNAGLDQTLTAAGVSEPEWHAERRRSAQPARNGDDHLEQAQRLWRRYVRRPQRADHHGQLLGRRHVCAATDGQRQRPVRER